MAFVSPHPKYPLPTGYMPCTSKHTPLYKYVSESKTQYVDKWSRLENTSVEAVSTEKKEVKLANGKTFTYKALVLAPGFKHETDSIEGLSNFDTMDHTEGCHNHVIDTIARVQ
jgi:NADH dehydrogenase FAD-containing subunit